MTGKSKKYWCDQFEKFSKTSSKQSEKNGYTLELRQFIASVKFISCARTKCSDAKATILFN